MKQALKELKRLGKYLTPQQYNTFKGQILKGNIQGFYKGVSKILK